MKESSGVLVFSPHAEKHKEDIRKYLEKLGVNVDPFSQKVLSFLQVTKGTQQTPNKRLGEDERWRLVLLFPLVQKSGT